MRRWNDFHRCKAWLVPIEDELEAKKKWHETVVEEILQKISCGRKRFEVHPNPERGGNEHDSENSDFSDDEDDSDDDDDTAGLLYHADIVQKRKVRRPTAAATGGGQDHDLEYVDEFMFDSDSSSFFLFLSLEEGHSSCTVTLFLS